MGACNRDGASKASGNKAISGRAIGVVVGVRVVY